MSIIDFHSHVLFKIDDGSKSLEMSTEMLKASKEQGVNIQIATPHFYADKMHSASFFERRSRAYDALRGIASDLGIDLRLGAEVAFFRGMREWAEVEKFMISGTNLLLIEMPFDQWKSKDISVIEELINQGVHPVIAHLERFFSYQKDKEALEELLDMNITVQFNCENLGRFFKRGKVLKSIDSMSNVVLGSDCHNVTNRVQNIKMGRDIIEAKLGFGKLVEIDDYGYSLLVN